MTDNGKRDIRHEGQTQLYTGSDFLPQTEHSGAAEERPIPRDDSVLRTVYRVQDREGRGPFRPGFSRHWFEDRAFYPPAFIDWFGDPRPHIKPGEHCGSGCRSLEQLAQWFTKNELRKLAEFGYGVVSLTVDRIIAENHAEVLFARRRPLRFGCSDVSAIRNLSAVSSD